MNHREGENINILKQVDSPLIFRDDYQYAQLLISGDSGAWDRFYRELRKKLAAYIDRRYPGVFSSVAVEEVCDGVNKRLTNNECRALREYRGECSFSSYITRAADWEVKDWLRRHAEELFHESLDDTNSDKKEFISCEPADDPSSQEENEMVPDIIRSLPDDLRWAFLLRYYDYFGFPADEIRSLARKKGVSIGSITEKIVRLLEPEGENILASQKEKQRTFNERLWKLCHGIHTLNMQEQRTLANEEHAAGVDQQGANLSAKLDVIRNKRLTLQGKRDALMKNTARMVITTPYEVVAEILGENNVSTIRSRMFLAKKQLAEKLKKNG